MERKVFRLLSFIFLIGLCMFSKTNEVRAATLRLDHAENVYYSRYGNGGPYVSNPHPLYYMDGHIGYCIEPGKEIYSYEYTGNLGMTKSPFSNEINKLIQLIGYYGYEYPGHGTLRYRLATQALIWEKVSGQTVRYYTERYDEGQEIIVDDEKNEIMRLVNNHTTKPSFKSTTLKGKVGENIIIEDTNQVLDFFEVSKSDKYKAQKSGNKLIITPTKAGISTITLKKARYDNVSTMVFSPTDAKSQKVAILRFSDEVSLDLKLESFGSKLKVIKVDSETSKVIKKSGIKFKLKDLSNNSYVCENTSCTFETNNNGEFTTNTYLYGDYELEEVDMAVSDYLWNSNKVKVHIDESKVGSDNVIEIKFANRRVKGKVIINKIGEKAVNENGTLKYEMVPLESVRFGLYASADIYQNGILIYKNGTLVKNLVTNSNGYVECNDLYLGKYYLKELEAPKGYLVDQNKYEFDLTYKNQYTEVVTKTFNLNNYLQKGKLVINKVGETINSNSEYIEVPLKDVKYNLYAGEDIYTNKFLVYKKDTLIKTLKTDFNGEIELSNLPLGKYYVIEVETLNDYIIDKTKHEFMLNASSDMASLSIFTLNLKNKLRTGKVIINKVGEKLVTLDDNYFYEEIPLSNVKYGLYANSDIYINESLVYKKGTLIKSVTTNKEGQAIISNLPLGNYYLMEIETLNDYLLDTTKHEFSLSDDNLETQLVVKSLDFKNYLKKGNIIINKIGEKVVVKDWDYSYESIPLSNVKYGLYANDDIYINESLVYKKGTLIKSVTTNKEGQAIISNLPLGNYYLMEIETLNDYLLDTTKHEFSLSDDNLETQLVVKSLDFKNYLKKENIIINKIGEKVVVKDWDYSYESIPLSNVKYGLYANDDIYINDILTFKKDKLIKTLKTDSNGICEIPNLPLGKYYLIELETLPGYILDDTKHEFELNEDNLDLKFETGNLVFKNFLKKGKLVIIKKGEEAIFENGEYYYQEKSLKGVKYGLYTNDDIYINQVLTYKKNTLVKIVETNDEGMASLDNLPLGKYYIMEIETLDDYVLDKTKYEFTLMDSDDEVMIKTFNLKNHLKKGRLEFLKVDSKTNDPLPKTLIEIYKELFGESVLLYRGYTDNNGKITLNDLPLGRYLLKEVKSSNGYNLSNEIFTFDITNDDDCEYITMKNDKIQEVEVPSTALDSNFIFKLAGTFLFLSGSFIIYYSKKKLD